MFDEDLEGLTKKLSETTVEAKGVSFQGQSLKLNTEDDVSCIIQKINSCENLEYLNLEGNTLGVDAAKAIAKALESHSEFKRALWKDMFTGRMKTEIPKALQYLGGGLVLAEAHLVELDLSDNAFGPIGVEGLASLLRSPPCFTLQTLRLNNNGLGVTGGELLARALLDCYNSSKEAGESLPLRVFVAGRNRLENDGSKALSEVIKMVETLEVLSMPQNGIYHVGITALSEALKHNPKIREINLNDNILTAKGAAALAQVLPSLQQLEDINLGDCLLKTKGAILLAEALADGHTELRALNLGFNEIGPKGAEALGEAMTNKQNLEKLELDGNMFGETGKQLLQEKLTDIGKIKSLGSLSEDEDDAEEEDGEEDDNEDEEDEENSDEESESNDEDEKPQIQPAAMPSPIKSFIKAPDIAKPNLAFSYPKINGVGTKVEVADFLKVPTAENFLALGNDVKVRLLEDIQQGQENDFSFLARILEVLMKVSSLCINSQVSQAALACTNFLYQEMFKWSANKDSQIQMSITNELMVHLGLLKSEWKFKPQWNLEGCWVALDNAIKQDYFPNSTKETLKLFLNRPSVGAESPAKHTLNITLGSRTP